MLHAFLTSAQGESERSAAPPPAALTRGKDSQGMLHRWFGGPKVCLSVMAERKLASPARNRTMILQLVG